MIGNRAFIALMVGWLLTSAVQAKPRPRRHRRRISLGRAG